MDEHNESPQIKKLKEAQEAAWKTFDAAVGDPRFRQVCQTLRKADMAHKAAKSKAELARNVTALPKFNPPLSNNGVPQLPPEPTLMDKIVKFFRPGSESRQQLPEEVEESRARNACNHAREEFNQLRDELRKKAFALVVAQDALLREQGQVGESDQTELNAKALALLVNLPALKGLEEYVLPR